MGPVPQLCPAGVTQPRPRGTPCTRLLATSQRSACRARPAQGRGTGAGRPLTRLAAAPQLSMLRISPSMGHPLDLSLALRHLLFLLEYCMVTGYDWWDILLHVQPAMVQSLVDRLHEEYTRQTAALQQVGRTAWRWERAADPHQQRPWAARRGQRSLPGREPGGSPSGSLAGAPQGGRAGLCGVWAPCASANAPGPGPRGTDTGAALSAAGCPAAFLLPPL